MTRTLMTLMLTLALVAGPVAADPQRPRAKQDDMFGLLIGSVLVGVVVSQLFKDDKKGKRHAQDRPRPAPQPAPRAPAPNPPLVVTIPGRCIGYADDLGGRYVVMRECLNQQGIALRHIPRHCRLPESYDLRDGRRYDLRCLEEQGWAIR